MGASPLIYNTPSISSFGCFTYDLQYTIHGSHPVPGIMLRMNSKRSIAALPAFTSPLGFPSPLQYSYPSIMSRPFTYSSIPSLTNFAGITPYSGIPAFSTYTAASPAMPRDAEMIKIKNNPGHATSYRVY
ncbi:hypothetical protein Pcinc_030844 [Petrolisthes cinctipes]|uniref:Uncharacterized protein n=1 Tax=Petrolisthes cinctipes TaxID=88211 RepID=A0AAE1K3W0_PETCI|nr:hypothetical protein Pcinc_030844 [Petrolisthes cinctipes]